MAVNPIVPAQSKIPNLEYLRQKDPKLHETIVALMNSIPSVNVPAPAPLTNINVSAQDGIFHVTVADSGQVPKGTGYFLEYDNNPNFPQPTVIDLGASRQYRGFLGNQTLHWRGYSQLPPGYNSPPSAPIVYGGKVPRSVSGGGAATGPILLPSTGSGTAPTNGQQGGVGHGVNLVRQA